MNARRWLPPFVWAAIILILTSLPGAILPHVPLPDADRLTHGALYGILGWLSMRAAWHSGRLIRTVTLVLACIALLGALDEWHQQFIAGRSMELLDWVADCFGATLGAAAAAGIRREEEA